MNSHTHDGSTASTDFSGTEEIFLERNYRSTAAILKASLAIVDQGKFFARRHMNVHSVY